MLVNSLLVGVIWYQIIAHVGISAGLHRYWAHRQGKRRAWFEWLSLSCALFIGVYKPIGWIGIHRLHHKYHDTPWDPHSPKHRGVWNVLLSRWSDPIPRSVIKDIINNFMIII